MKSLQIIITSASFFISICSVVAAVLSAKCAWMTYQLSKSIQNELKSDEKLIISKPKHLNNEVLTCALFNKSKRKVYVEKVKAYEKEIGEEFKPIDILWSNKISNIGKIENDYGLIGIIDTENLYVQKCDPSMFMECKLEIHHNFSNHPEIATFNASDNL